MPYQAGIFAVAAGIVLLRGFGDFRNDVATYVQSSRNFTTAILTAATRAKSEPNAQIVVEAISPYDLEPIFAVNRFLVSLGVTNPMFLRPHELTSAAYPKNAFFQGLIDTIEAAPEQWNHHQRHRRWNLAWAVFCETTNPTRISRHPLRVCLSVINKAPPRWVCPNRHRCILT